MDDGVKVGNDMGNICERHIVALNVTSGHNVENGGSGGARTQPTLHWFFLKINYFQ
jgi:hypothetical protein